MKIIDYFTNTSDKKVLVSNFFYLSILQAINYLLPLVTFPYLVRVLGVEYFGLLSFAGATVAYFNIITDYGFNLTATREISIHRDDKSKLSEIFSSVMIIKFALMCISFLLLGILIYSFEKFRKDAMIYFLIFGGVIGQVLFPVWFFQGIERMKYITYINLLSRLIFTVAIFIFVKKKDDYYMVPILGGLGGIVGGVYALYFIRRYFGIEFAFQKIDTLKYYLREATQIFISNVAISLYTVSTTFILGLFTNNTIVGYYAAADKIIHAFKVLMVPLSQTLYPFMSSKFHNDPQRAFRVIRKLAKVIFAFTFLISMFILLYSKTIIYLFLGNQFKDSIILLQIMSFLPMIVALSNLYAVQGLFALRRQEIVNNFLLKISLFHIMHIFITTYYFEAIGASISVVLTEILVTVFSMLKFNQIKKEVDSDEAIF
ncbi:MAG: flippase [Elusimicrobiota bacterium]